MIRELLIGFAVPVLCLLVFVRYVRKMQRRENEIQKLAVKRLQEMDKGESE